MTEEEFQQKRQEIEQHLKLAQDSVQELASVKEEALNLRRTILSRSTESEKGNDKIKELKTSAEQSELQIRASLEQVAKIISDIKEYEPTFQKLKSKVEDGEEGIEALHNKVEIYRDDASVLKKEAENLLVDVKGRLSDIEKLKVEATEGRDEIIGLAEESEILKKDIEKSLKYVTDSTLQESFKVREKDLFKFVIIWLAVSIFSFLLFAVGTIYVFTELAKNGFQGWEDWYRILFVAPLLYLTIWSSRNYAQERRLHEKYAFKAVISTSLNAYIKLLTDKFDNAQEEILDFTKNTLTTIFKEPYEDVDSKVKGNISLWNVFKVDVELDENNKKRIKDEVESKIEKTKKENNE